MSASLSVWLTLGRVSNLPTVWTNTLAAALLAGAAPSASSLALLLLAMSLAYTGGMYLNDAYDHEYDARERPERPIPSGQVSLRQVLAAGYAMLALSVVLVIGVAFIEAASVVHALTAALALIACIVLYDRWHKGNALSPLIMGLCRLMVYLSVALALTSQPDPLVYLAAVLVLIYLIGLTFTAKQESLDRLTHLWPLLLLATPALVVILPDNGGWLPWACVVAFLVWTLATARIAQRAGPGDIPRAVVRMIAGLCLIDAIYLATVAPPAWVVAAWLAFAATLALQRYVSGT